MSPIGIAVAEMILSAEVDGKLTRRSGNSGSFEYAAEKGRFPMLIIAGEPEHEVAEHAVVMDREEGGTDEMQKEGRKIVTAITATELFAIALLNGAVREEVFDQIMKNINNGKRKRECQKLERVYQEIKDQPTPLIGSA